MSISKIVQSAYGLLELDLDAQTDEIERAYQHLCRLYNPEEKVDAIILLEGEWGEEEREVLLEQIHEAYTKIQHHLKQIEPFQLEDTQVEVDPETIASEIEFDGFELRKLREQKGIGLHELYKKTQLPYKLLANIEQEKFSKLPEPGLLRWYISVYAKLIGLDPKDVADSYMKRYRTWKSGQT